MVILSDKTKIEMRWKQCTYIRSYDFVVFEIVPMLTGKDIIIIPSLSNWLYKQDVFSEVEREKIISSLYETAWKRDLNIVELNVTPYVNRKLAIGQGMIESTEGYIRITQDNLFDSNSVLNKEQVKQIYCTLEERFALAAQGIVRVPKELLLEGSIMKEISLPARERNCNVQISII